MKNIKYFLIPVLIVLSYFLGRQSALHNTTNLPTKNSTSTSVKTDLAPAISTQEEPSSDTLLLQNTPVDHPTLPTTVLEQALNITDPKLEIQNYSQNQDLLSILDVIFSLISTRRFSEADIAIIDTIDAMNGGTLNSPLWKGGAALKTTLLREVTQRYSECAEYLVHLAYLSPAPELLADFRLELLEGEAGTFVLGLNSGHVDGWVADLVPYYRERIENWNRSTFSNRHIVQSLGLIPTDESAILLADLLDWSASNMKLDIVQALANNRSPAAIDALEDLRLRDKNSRIILAVEDALKLLGM
ncbi:MAG: HEAT repeat domain-containing protein [Planctomycetia bacterium]|nr:HEAT repeat domain-containing protein [Planctomycetia bacterium]MBL6915913.1 HEAT repeat domain-containing protein [Planctomycetota bacterium]MDC0347225.1 HEAT repeat domain-containing protein [Planctomycetota bacterium]MDC3251359.1 HEAT repeat domain-containing protein [Planctomycetota bacterium]HCW44530.1 hypothetical protein [Planctomycetota bacterium]